MYTCKLGSCRQGDMDVAWDDICFSRGKTAPKFYHLASPRAESVVTEHCGAAEYNSNKCLMRLPISELHAFVHVSPNQHWRVLRADLNPTKPGVNTLCQYPAAGPIFCLLGLYPNRNLRCVSSCANSGSNLPAPRTLGKNKSSVTDKPPPLDRPNGYAKYVGHEISIM
ncbi:hypothetical protein M0657_008976 [Pyricularia oryzae]|nr:hypothetical protein M0657_008976 [Pyricularia oryzae]KAI7916708.1 hypothetical protein M9X92_007757 [Pyricularia oryzae]